VAGRALHGFAEITAGRVAEGLRTLDEVSASVLAGEVKDFVLMGLACCYLIAACERIRDYDRAAQWCDRLKESSRKWGLRPLFAVCRTQYASVCMWRGAWDEAERELAAATDELAASRPAMTGEGLGRLGELRRRQGKLDEALALFDRAATHPMASLGRALVAFDRGDLKAAVELAERYLRKLPLQNRTERAAGLELVCRAQIDLGNRVDSQRALEELRDIAARAQTDPLRASASLAEGIILARSGDGPAARRHLEDAVDLFQKGGAPFETARARVELARVLGRLGRLEPAAQEAQRAIDDFAQLHAELDLSRARDVLRDLERPAPAEPQPDRREDRGGLTVRELEVLRLISVGLSNQAIAQRLFISEHTVHRHVANTLTKLNVSSRSAAVAHVARLGIL
jgi:ATP/maltotriose-dependent transcriptional regulator MalT